MFFLTQDYKDEERLSFFDMYQPEANLKSPWEINDHKIREEEKEIPHILVKNNTNEYSNDTPQNTPGLNKLEERRQKGKIRSKKARDRKKHYLEELECKIKELETENARLNKIID